ncbi:MAG: sel1 repeat family protein [Candidatus Methanomethylophilus sp.]|nr:sel1 repeat family protein [Methanomethylophilus sp.]
MMRIASDAGLMMAAYSLANCYLRGNGTRKDAGKALELHVTLAEKGFAKSIFYLGESYYLGEQLPQDYSKAFELFTKGAEEGNVFCQYYLGECYRNGRGTKPDEAVAMRWYKKAADQGHIVSKRIIEDQRNKEILEDQTPFATFEKSARAGNAQSMYIVGRYYEDGIGIEKDLNKAKEWYRKAKKRGNSAAKRALEALEGKEEKE